MLMAKYSPMKKYRKRRSFRRVTTLGAAALLVYFIAHALMGERGLFALSRQRQDVALLRQQVEILAQRQQLLEEKTFALREENLDLDILEENVRHSLGWSEPNEQSFLDSAPNDHPDTSDHPTP